MVALPLDSNNQVVPPWDSYLTFSIDVAATLEDKKYAGYCLEVTNPSEEDSDYYAVHIRPVQQGLTKPHPRKPQHAQPTMCVPVLPATAHPRSREPPQVSKPLPWNNCYHPTCYDICLRIPAEQQDHFRSPYLNCFSELDKFVAEDMRYRQLLQAGPDNDRILRILDGQEEAPETDVPDYISQTESESQASQMFLAKVPGCDKLEEDLIFVPVLRVDHVLSNVPEISDPSQLCGDLDLFQEIVLEYQLALYGSAVFPQPELEIDDPHFHGKFSVDSLMSAASGTSTEELGSDSPESHAFDSSLADESEDSEHHSAPVPPRKGKWSVKLLFRRAIMNLVQFVKGHKFSTKLS